MVGSAKSSSGGNIAIVSSVFPPITGGMAIATYYHAALLMQHGFDVTVFTQDNLKEKNTSGFKSVNEQSSHDEKFSFKVKRLKPVYSKGFAAYTPHLKEELKEFDGVVLEYPAYGLAEAAHKAAQIYKIPLLLYYHMDNVADGMKGAIFSMYKKIMLPLMLRNASAVLVSSIEYACSSNLSKFLDQLQSKLTIVPLGVDSQRFYQLGKNPNLLRRHNIRQTEIVIGFVGALDTAHYFKGVPILLEALSKLKNFQPHIPFKCIIAGAGDLRNSYKARAAELGLGQTVLFPGRISDQELASYYQLFDIFVLPSVDSSEAFGLVILEAMASGLPVVVSDLPGPASLVSHEETGFIVPPLDSEKLSKALFALLRDSHLRAEMGERARGVVRQKYQWQSVGEKLYDCVSKNIPQTNRSL